jgi:hypothetical protein
MIDDVVGGTNPRPGIERTEQAEQGQERWHHQGEQLAPLGVEVGHAGREGNHQKRLRRQVGVGAVGQDAGFVLDFPSIEIQPLLG